MPNLIIGIHNHQPVGNFGHVLRCAYESAYLPFIQVLEKHPDVKVSIHFSGILYDWLRVEEKGYLKTLRRMAESGQLEIIGGAYYEPVLAVLPRADAEGQVARMKSRIRELFGVEAKGVWLAERVWEPELAAVLHDCGVEYTILDDAHFFSSGLEEKELDGYFTTEHSGKQVKVFPISQRLRYLMPFSAPEKTMEFLSGFRDRGAGCSLVMADDGEKFGLWPETNDLIYRKGWLDRMFGLIGENSSWLGSRTFSGQLSESRSRGLVYLPTASYYELTQWALPPAAQRALGSFWKASKEEERRFLRGSYFRNFFARYPESNRMYRKMLHVSSSVHAAGGGHDALESLWQSQCNCGYWHGVFGGLYLPHIRTANYRNMIEAEKAAGVPAPGKARMTLQDWDGDGDAEVLVETRSGNWYFNPAQGGSMFEWDWKEGSINWMNVLSRREEAYHAAVAGATVMQGPGSETTPGSMKAKQPELASKIIYDWHSRAALLDHFLHPDTTPDSFSRAKYGEQGDFVTAPYKWKEHIEENAASVELWRQGVVWTPEGSVPVAVRKKVCMEADGSWNVRYTVANRGGRRSKVWFGAELPVSFSEEKFCGTFEKYGIRSLSFSDTWQGRLDLSFDKDTNVWAFPLKTVSQSEEGFELTYQGSVLLFHHVLELEAGGEFSFTISIKPGRAAV